MRCSIRGKSYGDESAMAEQDDPAPQPEPKVAVEDGQREERPDVTHPHLLD